MEKDLDGSIVRVARGQGALDLALGEALELLFAPGRLMKVSYSTERDYSRERLGLPVGTMHDALDLARACSGRPLLRKAVARGLVTPSKARTIAPVVASSEAAWTALAMTSTVRELRASVRAAGKEPPEEFEGARLRIKMTPAQQDRLGKALALANETLGGGATRWQCLEAIAQEYLGEHGGLPPEEEGERRQEDGDGKPLPERVTEHLAAIEAAQALVGDQEPPTNDPQELDARAVRFAKARQERDAAFGPLALRVVQGRVWLRVGYRTIEEYCVERLGMSPSAFRRRVWLERYMFELPALREALESGRITYSKALLIARDATRETIEALIARAADTTWQQTEREARERQDRKDRRTGVRRLWAPKEVMRTVLDAIGTAQRLAASEGKGIDRGEALALVADHFHEVWSKLRRKQPTPAQGELLRRNGGTCEVPGCSLPARHAHHIRYRSHGGTDDPWNKVRLCVPHHLHGIHEGCLKVTGRAGEYLIWNLANGETWETRGDNEVRRADAEPDGVHEPRAAVYECGASQRVKASAA